MVAVYIDPAQCHSWVAWITPECWGIAVQSAIYLALALTSAYSLRRFIGAQR